MSSAGPSQLKKKWNGLTSLEKRVNWTNVYSPVPTSNDVPLWPKGSPAREPYRVPLQLRTISIKIRLSGMHYSGQYQRDRGSFIRNTPPSIWENSFSRSENLRCGLQDVRVPILQRICSRSILG